MVKVNGDLHPELSLTLSEHDMLCLLPSRVAAPGHVSIWLKVKAQQELSKLQTVVQNCTIAYMSRP